jgi:hypothetical protein
MLKRLKMTTISIARDFSQFPAGRNKSDGPHSGEAFREDVLVPALQKDDAVSIDMDGVLGYGSSFLEEAFGGLIREHHMAFDALKHKLSVKCSVPVYEKRVWQYLEEASSRAGSAK